MKIELELYSQKTFEDIKHLDENENEYWLARELMTVLDYKSWDKFKSIINKAKISCQNSGLPIEECFSQLGKSSKMPNGGVKYVNDYDYILNRYACYLVAQNGSPRKKQIALAQTYFAIQTRKQEITEEEFKQLTEDEKRLYNRKIVKDRNKILYGVAKEAGVINYGKFTNYGYKGLYNNESMLDIKQRKGLKDKDDILDFMGGEELGANIFRITQTEA